MFLILEAVCLSFVGDLSREKMREDPPPGEAKNAVKWSIGKGDALVGV